MSAAVPADTASLPRYRLIGANGSPYTMKLRAILRYRQIPHVYVVRSAANRAETEHVRPAVIPILQFPEDGRYLADSTPLAYLLEERHPGPRSIMPPDPGQAFLSHLIEDFADEWLTKAMFHYRWHFAADIDYAGLWIADESFPALKGRERGAQAHQFAARQIGRMPLVGCTPENAPIIEATYLRVLDLLDPHVGLNDYLFGARPALADFALKGQLTPLATDPTPLALMRAHAQRVESWVRLMDDLSGLEPGPWRPAEQPQPRAVEGLLDLIGEFYLPFLVANAAALEAGQETVELTLMGLPWRQQAFRYQGKCLADLLQRFAALPGDSVERLAPLLERTGCLETLAA